MRMDVFALFKQEMQVIRDEYALLTHRVPLINFCFRVIGDLMTAIGREQSEQILWRNIFNMLLLTHSMRNQQYSTDTCF